MFSFSEEHTYLDSFLIEIRGRVKGIKGSAAQW